MPPRPLTYAVVIATYNRRDILPICIEHVLRQEQLPKEIVIVDASSDWEQMHERLKARIRSSAPEIVFHHVAARTVSIPAQRNQGIALATADVLFLIDDDSLMFPDCAREVLAVYEADCANEVAGVQTALADHPPTGDLHLPNRKQVGTAGWTPSGGTVEWINRHVFMMATDLLFLPYWADDVERRRIPLLPGTRRVALFQGCRMTFRRDVIARVGFDADLHGYAAGEDLDASYRVSRHGVLLQADRALLYHHAVASGRIPRGQAAELSAMNIAFFLRKNAPGGVRPAVRLYAWLARRTGTELLKDVFSRRFELPQVRAMLHATAEAWRLWTYDPAELSDRYAEMQRDIVNRYAKASGR